MPLYRGPAGLAQQPAFTNTYAGRTGVGDVSGSPGARRAQFAFSGAGFTNGGALADFHQRTIVHLPVTTSRWRLRMRNARADGVGIAGAFNVNGVYVGTPVFNSFGLPNGSTTAAPAQAIPAFATAADGATDTVSDWVTDPTLQIPAHQPRMLSLGWTTAATATARGCGFVWYTSGTGKNADAAVAVPSGISSATNHQTDMRLEYEFAGSSAVGLALGDSLVEGFYNSGTSTDPLYLVNTWHQMYGQRNGLPMCSAGYYGSQTSQWTSTSAWDWTRWAGSGLTIDFAVVALGSNDANAGVTLATYQANMISIVNNLRAAGIPRIYLSTIAPRSLAGANETLRGTYNTWLRRHPQGVNGIVDFDDALASAADATILKTGYGDTDSVHWTPLGHHFAAQKFGAAVMVA